MEAVAVLVASATAFVWLAGLSNLVAARRSPDDYRRPGKLLSLGLPTVALAANLVVAVVAYTEDNSNAGLAALAGILFALAARFGFLARPGRT